MGDWGDGPDTDEVFLGWNTRLDSDGRPYDEGDLDDEDQDDEDQDERDRRESYRTGGGWLSDDASPEARRALHGRTAARRKIKKRAQQKHRAHRAIYKRRRKPKRRQPEKRTLGWWLTKPPRR
jgi:hypothetical protein